MSKIGPLPSDRFEEDKRRRLLFPNYRRHATKHLWWQYIKRRAPRIRANHANPLGGPCTDTIMKSPARPGHGQIAN